MKSWLAASALLIGCGSRHAPDATPDAGATERQAWTRSGDVFVRARGAASGEWLVDRSGVTWSVAGARLALRTSRIGRGDSLRDVAAGAPGSSGARVEIDRGGGVHEWLVPHPTGLEQGFDVATRPPGDDALTIVLAVDGLTPQDEADGRSIALSAADGARRMTIRGLSAFDAAGVTLRATMHAEGANVVLRIDDRDARYPVVIDPIYDAALVQTLSTPSTFAGYSQATAISSDGATMFVGHRAGSITSGSWGAVTIFQQGPSGWTYFGALDTGIASGTSFGEGVAVQGNLALVGAPQEPSGTGGSQGAVHAFAFDGASWKQEQVIRTNGFGAEDRALALQGTTAIFGASETYAGSTEAVGAVHVYQHSSTGWSRTQLITPPALYAKMYGRFGRAVAFDGGLLAVGGGSEFSGTGSVPGRLYLYEFGSTGWTFATDIPSPYSDPNGTFAYSLALKGNLLFVGSPEETVGGNASQGAVWRFVKSTSGWTMTERITLAGGAAGGRFGSRVAFDGTNLLIAEGYASGPTSSTYAYLFREIGGSWTETNRIASTYPLGPAIALVGGSSAVAINPWTTPTYTGHDAVQIFTVGTAPQGSACTRDADCVTGHCADGVCCNVPCTGACQSCAETGSVGTCKMVAGAPRAPRAACSGAGTTCGGVCDGTSANCTFAKAGAVCGAGCVGAAIALCDGKGTCSSPTACPGGFVCGADACKTSCASSTDCVSGSYCKAGSCVGMTAVGVSCTGSAECTTGFCVDGVCCDTACTGQCESCGEAGAVGSCTAVKGTPRGARAACTGGSGTCAGSCDGGNRAACAYPSKKACGCAGDIARACDGAGHCAAASACPGHFLCADTTSCKTSCTSPGDCVGGFMCVASRCVPAVHWTCSADGSQSMSDVEGAPGIACAPYTCGPDGTCRHTCVGDDECATGNLCDTQTYGVGVCVPPRQQADSSDGGCSIGRAPSQHRVTLPVGTTLSLLTLWIARRRRARGPGRAELRDRGEALLSRAAAATT